MGPLIWHLCQHSHHSHHVHSHHSHHSSHKASFKKHLLKLEVKFVVLVFNGDVNPENIDNWIRQVEVYFRVQHIDNWILFHWKALLSYGGR